MNLIALGINHTTASLDVREKVAFASSHLSDALSHAKQFGDIDDIAILSTCNRTEIYSSGNATPKQLLTWLAQYKHVDIEQLLPVHYAYEQSDAANHMMRVACGLDSQVLGEPQILGQMKTAYNNASDANMLNGKLYSVFQFVFNMAKKVRTQTKIGENPVSVAYAAVSLAQQIFADLNQGTALLIGAGETIDLAAKHIVAQGIGHLIVANRTLKNAEALADHYGGEAIVLSDIPKYLSKVDIVISSTASQLPVLGKGAVEQALKARKHKPMFMVDIAVPRDIEPQVDELDDVYLYTVDDLKGVIDENMKSREQAAKIAQEIINEGLKQLEREMRAQQSVGTIKNLREHVELLKQSELAKAKKMLASGADPEQTLELLARNLSNKLLHTPSTQLKAAAQDGHTHVIQSAQILFDLPPSDTIKSEK